jgi:hypothetical protein
MAVPGVISQADIVQMEEHKLEHLYSNTTHVSEWNREKKLCIPCLVALFSNTN